MPQCGGKVYCGNDQGVDENGVDVADDGGGVLPGGAVYVGWGAVAGAGFYGGVLWGRAGVGVGTVATAEGGISAITFGDLILGRDGKALDECRVHEQVHVRQAHRWGPLFLPAYLGASFWIWWRGGDPYMDNPFEVEAYRVSDPHYFE